MAIINVTSSGQVSYGDGDTVIIHPSVAGFVTLRHTGTPDDGSPPTVNILVQGSNPNSVNIIANSSVDDANVNVTVEAGVQAPNMRFNLGTGPETATQTISIGDGAETGGIQVSGSASDDQNTNLVVDIGEGARINGDLSITGKETSPGAADFVDMTIGNGATINGSLTVTGEAPGSATIGDNVTIDGPLTLGSNNNTYDNDSDTLVIGDNFTVNGNIATGGGDDNVTLTGDGYQNLNNVKNVNLNGGDDTLRLTGNFSESGSNQIIYAGGDGTDTLVFEPISDAQRNQLISQLQANGYSFDPQTKTWSIGGSAPAFNLSAGTSADGNDTIRISTFENIRIVCFAAGTRIRTSAGLVPIEKLQRGQLVSTPGGLQRVLWINETRHNSTAIAANDKLRPVLIRKDALGVGRPLRDMRVSRQHRILLQGPEVQDFFGCDQVLIAANKLVGLPGIEADAECSEIQYFHIVTLNHEVIEAEGVCSETLLPGPMAKEAMGEVVWARVVRCFPQLNRAKTPPAATVPSNRDQKDFVSRLIATGSAPSSRSMYASEDPIRRELCG